MARCWPSDRTHGRCSGSIEKPRRSKHQGALDGVAHQDLAELHGPGPGVDRHGRQPDSTASRSAMRYLMRYQSMTPGSMIVILLMVMIVRLLFGGDGGDNQPGGPTRICDNPARGRSRRARSGRSFCPGEATAVRWFYVGRLTDWCHGRASRARRGAGECGTSPTRARTAARAGRGRHGRRVAAAHGGTSPSSCPAAYGWKRRRRVDAHRAQRGRTASAFAARAVH